MSVLNQIDLQTNHASSDVIRQLDKKRCKRVPEPNLKTLDVKMKRSPYTTNNHTGAQLVDQVNGDLNKGQPTMVAISPAISFFERTWDQYVSPNIHFLTVVGRHWDDKAGCVFTLRNSWKDADKSPRSDKTWPPVISSMNDAGSQFSVTEDMLAKIVVSTHSLSDSQ